VILQHSTLYTDPEPSKSPTPKLQNLHVWNWITILTMATPYEEQCIRSRDIVYILLLADQNLQVSTIGFMAQLLVVIHTKCTDTSTTTLGFEICTSRYFSGKMARLLKNWLLNKFKN